MNSLVANLRSIVDQLADRANTALQDWDFDSGGACDEIADALSGAVYEQFSDIGMRLGGHDGDDHAWLIITHDQTREACGLDVPARVYETGGGYSWEKIPDAVIETCDVIIWELSYDDVS